MTKIMKVKREKRKKKAQVKLKMNNKQILNRINKKLARDIHPGDNRNGDKEVKKVLQVLEKKVTTTAEVEAEAEEDTNKEAVVDIKVVIKATNKRLMKMRKVSKL